MPPLLHKVPKTLRELAEVISARYIYLRLVQFIQLAIHKGELIVRYAVWGIDGVEEIPHRVVPSSSAVSTAAVFNPVVGLGAVGGEGVVVGVLSTVVKGEKIIVAGPHPPHHRQSHTTNPICSLSLRLLWPLPPAVFPRHVPGSGRSIPSALGA